MPPRFRNYIVKGWKPEINHAFKDICFCSLVSPYIAYVVKEESRDNWPGMSSMPGEILSFVGQDPENIENFENI